MPTRPTESPAIRLLRYGTAAVWLFHGGYSKVSGGFPRHQKIVERVVGPALAGPVTKLVGAAEVGMGLWILSKRWPRRCAATQTVMLVGMNVLELAFARDLLLAPAPMVAANSVFLSLGWVRALHPSQGA